jgi:uncharacterized membrane protein
MARTLVQRLVRLVRHRLRDERDTRRAMPPDLLQRITQRVGASEARHSGEIRVYVEASLPTSYVMRDAPARERAVAMFGKLRAWDTEHNNGVLVYLLLVDRAIEIVADRGVTARVPQSEWDRIVGAMREALQAGRFEEGITSAVDEVTLLLVRHFPLDPKAANPNELPDEPVLG